MTELSIITLCHALSNLTHHRCTLVENSTTCRCTGNMITPSKLVLILYVIISFVLITKVSSPAVTVAPSSNIMFSEVLLIFFVLSIWLSTIGFCLHQYKSLRRLETQVHYCVNRKDPLNIGDIKIVAREQDSIIYKKKRYSTLLDTQMNAEKLKSMQYVQQYLPKTSLKTIPSALSILIHSRDDLTASIPLATISRYHSSTNIPSNKSQELIDYIEQDSSQQNWKIPTVSRAGKSLLLLSDESKFIRFFLSFFSRKWSIFYCSECSSYLNSR